MLRTSSSKPRSIIRSASSIQRNLQLLRANRFFSNMSINLPGVATTMWRPLLMTWLWSFIEIPPMQRSVFSWGYLSSASAEHHDNTFSYVWVASSLEGHKIMPTGPSPLTKGSFISSSKANIIKGRQKASVLPEPVNAIPIKSRPENLNREIKRNNPKSWGLTPQEYLVIEWGSDWQFSSTVETEERLQVFSYPVHITVNLERLIKSATYSKIFYRRRNIFSVNKYVILLSKPLMLFLTPLSDVLGGTPTKETVIQ